MEQMDKSLLVAVFVPTTDDAGTDFQGKEGELATGYPVALDLVLTARHVLHPRPPRYRDPRYPVKLRWHYHRTGDNKGWIDIEKRNIVWESEGDLDAVLIRFPHPKGVKGWGIVAAERPGDGFQWVSEGLPRASEQGTQRKPGSFLGKVMSKAEQEPYFELTVESGPEHEEDWSGASGMPVFVGRKVLGVVNSVPRKYGAERLHATPTWQLLQDENFRNALGYDSQQAWLRKVEERLTRLLDAAPQATVNALLRLLAPEAELRDKKQQQQAKEIAAHLLQSDVRDALAALRKAHKELLGAQGDEDGDKGAGVILEIALHIAPAIYDYGVVRWTSDQRSAGATLVPLPACTKTVAEIIMAGMDEREARLRQRESIDDQPEGELCLPLAPELGIDAGPEEAAAALETHLGRKVDLQDMQDMQELTPFHHAVEFYLLDRFSRPSRGAPERDREQRRRLTADVLEDRREDGDPTFYMLFYPPLEEAGRNQLQQTVERLKDDYPALMFLALDPSFDQERVDRKFVGPLCRMLPLKDGDGETYVPAGGQSTDSRGPRVAPDAV